MCETECQCAICEIKSLEEQGLVIKTEEELIKDMNDYHQEAMNIFEKFIKSGIGS